MRLQRLAILNFRNLVEVRLEPAARINLVIGPNASGKTGLLEAIHVLSCGKSFRTHKVANTVRSEQNCFTVTGQILGEDGERTTLGVGYCRSEGMLRMKVAGRSLRRTSELAARLPVVAIQQDSHFLFSAGPRFRRRFLDWGLFHVEHGFLDAWQRFMRALRQRNSALQQHAARRQTDIWIPELQEAASYIHGLRETYLAEFLPIYQDYVARLLGLKEGLGVRYHPGWPQDRTYQMALEQSWGRDSVQGYTHYGPHRADVVFRIDGVPLHERVSRGQQKLLVIATYLAFADIYRRRTGRECILMIDDVAAEIDAERLRLTFDLLEELALQTFLSHTEGLDRVLGDLPQKLFHVEQGTVKEVL